MTKYAEPHTAQLLLRITPKLKARIIKAAKRDKVKMAEWVRQTLVERLTR